MIQSLSPWEIDVDFDMPSAEGQPGYPQDLLDMSEGEICDLMEDSCE